MDITTADRAEFVVRVTQDTDAQAEQMRIAQEVAEAKLQAQVARQPNVGDIVKHLGGKVE